MPENDVTSQKSGRGGEMADAADLKSAVTKVAYGFESHPRHGARVPGKLRPDGYCLPTKVVIDCATRDPEKRPALTVTCVPASRLALADVT